MKPNLLAVCLLTVLMPPALFAAAAESSIISPVSADAVVWIKSPQDGERVSSPVTLSFGHSDVEISPAGTERANSGHHHLLINLQALPAMDMPLPANAQVIHFGGGQTETTLELESGVHSLQLLLGNHLHVPHARPVMSEKITIIVE